MPRAPNGNDRDKDKATLSRTTLSERDSLRVLALLENPPAANERIVRVAKAGFVLPATPIIDAPKREN